MTEGTVVSLHSSMSCCQAIRVGTAFFPCFQKNTEMSIKFLHVSLVDVSKSVCISELQLGYKHWEHRVQAVCRAVMYMFGLCFGTVKRWLIWKTAEMQLEGQTHAVFCFFAEGLCVN